MVFWSKVINAVQNNTFWAKTNWSIQTIESCTNWISLFQVFFSFLLNSHQAHISNGCLKKYWQNILNSFTLFQSFFSQVCLKYFQLSHDMVTIFWNFKGRMKIKQKKFQFFFHNNVFIYPILCMKYVTMFFSV